MTLDTCVVTGAASGIGYGIAERFLRGGWAVVGLDLDGPGLAGAAERLTRLGSFHPVVGDVADRADLERAASAVPEGGRLRCWVNNAGYNIHGSVHELDPASYERGVAVDLGGVFWGTSVAVRHFLARDGVGSIVNISSVTALQGFDDLAAYAMCKGGIISLTRQVAAEFVGRGIRCNAIAPGVIDTPINHRPGGSGRDPETGRFDAETERLFAARCPMGRPGQPSDVAEAAFFLAGEDTAGYITGQTLVVDGGCTVVAPR